MRGLWKLIGQLCFWASWPLLYVYLRSTKRTRALIIADGSVLLVKGWLGPGKWDLPGGGLHKSEDEIAGVIREVAEETGLQLAGDQYQKIESGRHSSYGLHFSYTLFFVELPQKISVRKQYVELIDARWLPVSELSKHKCDPLVSKAIVTWKKDKNLIQ